MNNLQKFEIISDTTLSNVNGGYNRLAGRIGHYTGKAALWGIAVAGLFLIWCHL